MGGLRKEQLMTHLVMRILEQPGVVAAVRDMPGARLAELVDQIGLEDAGELIALASTEQLERLFDVDLWRADRAGDDETFRPERFALWLRVMREAGEEVLVQRLSELPQDLVALAVHRLALVLDMDVVEEQLGWAGDEAAPIEQALEAAAFEQWEEFRVIARAPDVWEDLWTTLVSLDRDHHDRLRAILEQCCAMSTEYISGQGGLYQVLTSDEMLESDVAAAREDRRAAEGFVSPADARAFLELARRGDREDERDPFTRAYFRAVPAARLDLGAERRPRPEPAAPAEVTALAGRSHLVAPLFEEAMSEMRQRDPALFAARVRELGYLVNVWMAGGAHEGRSPRPIEALELVLRTCDAGLAARLPPGQIDRQQALAVLTATPADALFRRGFRATGVPGRGDNR
jgi:Family of unknown function (DUF6178)